MTDTILIIEDEPTLRRELISALSQASFAVADVPNYSEALLKLDEFKPDMVIWVEMVGRRALSYAKLLMSPSF